MDDETTPVIATAVRTPQGRRNGVFAETRPEDLSVTLVDHILDANGLDGEDVDDLVWGCAQQRSVQDNNLARVITLMSELGEGTPGTTINRWCASSMTAIARAADSITAGQREAVIAGGVEHMTMVPMDLEVELHPDFVDRYNVGDLQMGMTAEKVAEQHDITREEQDAFALRSHERAAAATEEGRFDDEIVPVETEDGTIDTDEGIRFDTSLDKLGQLDPVFKGDGTVTAGNASQISDGASATLVCSQAFADEHDLQVLGTVEDHNVVGVDPTVMGIGPAPATEGLLERTGQDIEDFDLVEINEAFASQCLYAQRRLGVPDEKFNVNGGAIALGHPLGASGARLPVTLLHAMDHQDADRGLATLCVGFGQGMAIAFEAE